MSKLQQYVASGRAFMPAGKSFDTPPPGVYRVESTMQGWLFVPKSVTSDELTIFPKSPTENLLEQLRSARKTSPAVFKKAGFTHKRGFLLYGEQGTGKTAAITLAVAEAIKAGELVVMMTAPHWIAPALTELREVSEDIPVTIVIEHIDDIVQEWGPRHLLALLSGEDTVDHVTFIATTNYPERLTPAIKRPGRFDTHIEFEFPNETVRYTYLRSKLGEVKLVSKNKKTYRLDTLVKATEGMSIPHLKEIVFEILVLKRDIEEILENMKSLLSS